MEIEKPKDNERLLQATPNRGVVAELWGFLVASGKWWMLPILVLLLLFGLALVLGNTALAPFLYPLF